MPPRRGAPLAPLGSIAAMRRVPDNVLLRRFGHVRAAGGGAYVVAVAVLLGIFGARAWPLAIGVPVLAVVTTAYFNQSARHPRAAVAASLVADAVVLGGAIAFLGGTGSGLVLLYAIVVVSAGILLGPAAAAGFTALSVALGLLQLLAEQLGHPPVLLHRPELGERLPVLAVSLAGLISVGYLSATYASRLHELIAEAGEQAEVVRRRGRRRRSFAARAFVDVAGPLRRLEEVADDLDDRWDALDDTQRRRLAGRLRMGVTAVDAELAQLADVNALDETDERRLAPVALPRVVDDCVAALGDRLDAYDVTVDVPPLKVVADGRAVRRVVLNLLDNVVEHTPAGTAVSVTAVAAGSFAVLVVTDDGPGVADDVARGLFAPPVEPRGRRGDVTAVAPRVGLPLVAELCAAMGAQVRHERPPAGGARFLVKLRRAPGGAPSDDDEPATLDHVAAGSRLRGTAGPRR